MQNKPFDRDKAIETYTKLMRYIDAGAYNEREHDGSYGEDGIDKALDDLIDRANINGLKFVGQKSPYTIEPMTEKEIEEYQAARLSGVLDVAKDQVSQDMPYVEVTGARPFQYHFNSQRWYVEIDVKHMEEGQGEAVVLCRVWMDKKTGFLKAVRVTVV